MNDIAASTTGALSILRDFYEEVCREENKTLPESGEPLQWIFLLSDNYIEEREHVRVLVQPDIKKSWKNRLLFDLKDGGRMITDLKPDVYFSLQNTLTKGISCKTVLYVHQPLGFQRLKRFSFFKQAEREYAVYQYLIARMINRSIRRADKTIVQTEWMRQEILRRTHTEPSRVVKIAPDLKLPENMEAREQASPLPGERIRFFFPSGPILYKNHDIIVKACQLLKEQGITDYAVILTLSEEELTELCPQAEGLISDGASKQRPLICRGRIPREEVFSLYRDSVLLFPSYIESFGYPPAEARAAGGFVLATDTEACREVLQGYERALYFDPFQPEALSALMKQAIRGELPKERESRSLSQGRQEGTDDVSGESRSWQRVIRELLI
ncbi:MAG: glycosyltransferase [Lachnospiraceae bacterium]|nr:glycosyltransferase [Lachnospiraceae bacterium]